MNKPHKWAKEIKAWADGAEIEFRLSHFPDGEWIDAPSPDFNDTESDFRIKPQPKEPQYLYAYFDYKELAVKWSITGGNIGQGDYIGKISLGG